MSAAAVLDHPRARLTRLHGVHPSLLEGLGSRKEPVNDHVGRVGGIRVAAIRGQNLPKPLVDRFLLGGTKVRGGGLVEGLGAVRQSLRTLGRAGYCEESSVSTCADVSINKC
eukprot:9503801-Pyramimonas_sp.AAC.2